MDKASVSFDHPGVAGFADRSIHFRGANLEWLRAKIFNSSTFRPDSWSKFPAKPTVWREPNWLFRGFPTDVSEGADSFFKWDPDCFTKGAEFETCELSSLSLSHLSPSLILVSLSLSLSLSLISLPLSLTHTHLFHLSLEGFMVECLVFGVEGSKQLRREFSPDCYETHPKAGQEMVTHRAVLS